MENIHVDEIPELRNPLFVLAFEGWNDAAQSASIAARFLVSRFNGKRFAWFESDDYFQFSEQRPQVRLDIDGNRKITWPENAFYYCQHPDLSRDLVVCIGVEPQLKWQSFSRDVTELARRCGIELAVTLGGLLAGNSHEEPLALVCLATESRLVELTGLPVTKYEGPTGIVGVIHTRFQDERIPAASLWVNIPQNIASLPNPKGAHALLDRFGAVGEIHLDLSELANSAEQFDQQVEEAIEKDPGISRFLSQMGSDGGMGEEELEEEPEDEAYQVEDTPGDELPSGEELADEIETFLRRRGNGDS
jgi:proteasome assembly chaperone (PAC2) family protein